MAKGRRNPNPAGHLSPAEVKAQEKLDAEAAEQERRQIPQSTLSPNVYEEHKSNISNKRQDLDDAQMAHASAYKAASKDMNTEPYKIIVKLRKMSEDKRNLWLKDFREMCLLEGFDKQPDLFDATTKPKAAPIKKEPISAAGAELH